MFGIHSFSFLQFLNFNYCSTSTAKWRILSGVWSWENIPSCTIFTSSNAMVLMVKLFILPWTSSPSSISASSFRSSPQGSPQWIVCLHVTLSSTSSPSLFSRTSWLHLALVWQLQPQHPSTDTSTIYPNLLSLASVSKTSTTCCPSDGLNPDSIIRLFIFTYLFISAMNADSFEIFQSGPNKHDQMNTILL